MLVCIYYTLLSNEQITFLIKKGVQMLQDSWILYDCVWTLQDISRIAIIVSRKMCLRSVSGRLQTLFSMTPIAVLYNVLGGLSGCCFLKTFPRYSACTAAIVNLMPHHLISRVNPRRVGDPYVSTSPLERKRHNSFYSLLRHRSPLFAAAGTVPAHLVQR